MVSSRVSHSVKGILILIFLCILVHYFHPMSTVHFTFVKNHVYIVYCRKLPERIRVINGCWSKARRHQAISTSPVLLFSTFPNVSMKEEEEWLLCRCFSGDVCCSPILLLAAVLMLCWWLSFIPEDVWRPSIQFCRAEKSRSFGEDIVSGWDSVSSLWWYCWASSILGYGIIVISSARWEYAGKQGHMVEP